MELFLSYSVDMLSQDFERATLEDDADMLRRMNQAMERGNKIWESWVLSFGGSAVTLGFGVGILQVAADRLSEVSRVKEEFASAIGKDVSVGIGARISEAEKALKAAKLTGGDKIVLYDEQVEETIAENEHRANTEDELGNIFGKSELIKGQPAASSPDGPFSPDSEASISSSMSNPALNQGGGGGMSGASQPTTAAPMGEASEHSQGEAMKAMMEEDNPGPSEGTHAADEDALHQIAEGQEKDDKDKDTAEQEGNSHIASIKQEVIKVLQQVKAQAQILEQVKQQAPEVYKTIMGMVQAVILMARELNKKPDDQQEGEDVQKSEIDWAAEFPLEKAIKDIRLGAPLDINTLEPNQQRVWGPRINHAAHYDYSHVLPDEARSQGYRLIVAMSEPNINDEVDINANALHPSEAYDAGGVSGSMKWSDRFNEPVLRIHFTQVRPDHQRKGLGKACYEAMFAHALNKLGIQRVVGGTHATGASAIHSSLSAKHGLDYKPKKSIGPGTQYHDYNEWEQSPNDDFDEKYKAYNYELKSEMDMTKGELEGLAKMAKIHDDAKNPKVLYRVQNAKGLGPYNAGYEGSALEARDLAYNNYHRDTNSQPVPWDPEEYPTEESAEINRRYFGFETPEQAEAWFGKDNLKRLGQIGFPLVQVHGTKVWRSNSGKQVFFEPTTPGQHPMPISSAPVRVSRPSKKLKPEPTPEFLEDVHTRKSEYDPDELAMGAKEEMEHTDDPEEAESIAKDHLREDPKYYSKLKSAGLMQKKMLPMAQPKKTTRHHLEVPVGTTFDNSASTVRQNAGKMKVEHGDGSTSRVSLEAGQIMAQDGKHPISSLNPRGR